MYAKKRKFENRKTKSSRKVMEKIQYNKPSQKFKKFDEEAKNEEESLSKELFGDSAGFLENLEDTELFSTAEQDEEQKSEASDNEERNKPVWHDEDDDNINLKDALITQGRNLVDGGINDKSALYSEHLKEKHKTYYDTPKWAKLNKTTDEVNSDDELLQTTGYLVKSAVHTLPKNVIEFKKLRDLNAETYSEGPLITSVEFHPSSTVALVAGVSGIASLFAVDGRRNNKLHSVSFEKYPIECTRFLKNGTEVLIGSGRPHFYSYDLMDATAVRVPLPHGMTQCKKFVMSPCQKYIAVVGKWGEVHLLTTDSKEKITTLKQNLDVTDILFNTSGSLLFGHSCEGEVTVWDTTNQRVVHKWNDEGCIRGTKLAMSPSGQLIATGSAQGVVNVYDIETVLKQKNPKPKKTVLNLTTSISSLEFNNTSEILAMSSSDMSNSIKLLHTASGNVFNNFPQWGTKFGRINTLAFSPNSGYAAFGNRKSTVCLYRLKHFKNY